MDKKKKFNFNDLLIFIGVSLILYVFINSLIVNNYSIVVALSEIFVYLFSIIFFEGKSIILTISILCIIIGIYGKRKISDKNNISKYKFLKFVSTIPFILYIFSIIYDVFSGYSAFGDNTGFIGKIFSYAFFNGLFLSPFLVIGLILCIVSDKKIKKIEKK